MYRTLQIRNTAVATLEDEVFEYSPYEINHQALNQLMDAILIGEYGVHCEINPQQ